MSDALAEWTEAELRELLAFAANPACIEVAIEAPRLVSLCTLALRGLAREPLEWPETAAEITAAHIEEACETIMRGNTHRNDVISSLGTIRRLAIRGLEAERVREETLEECAAIADGWDFGAPISREIRALKRGPSDAK